MSKARSAEVTMGYTEGSARKFISFAGLIGGGGLFLRWLYLLHKRRRHTWEIAGLSIGLSRQQVIRLKGQGALLDSNGMYFPADIRIILVEFDKKGLVSALRGFSLDGPHGCFVSGDALQKVRRKMGDPDVQGRRWSIYYRAELAILIGHIPEEDRIESFYVCKYVDHHLPLDSCPISPHEDILRLEM